jgi:hypothetical protein
LPFPACALERSDLLSLVVGQFPVQTGKFEYRLAEQGSAIIALAGMLDVGERLFGLRQASGDLTPHRGLRALVRALHRLNGSQMLKLAVQPRQLLELLAASRTQGKMTVQMVRLQAVVLPTASLL